MVHATFSSTQHALQADRPQFDRRSRPMGLFAAIGIHAAIFALILLGQSKPEAIEAAPVMMQIISEVRTEAPRPLPRQPRSSPALQQAMPVTTTPAVTEAAAVVPASLPAAHVAPQTEVAQVITQPRFDAAYLNNPAPPYPNLSRRMREQGTTLLRVYVTVEGEAEHVEIKRSSGFPRLDSVAQETVRRWRFIPARRGEEKVAAWVIVPIDFSLA
ncbi:MAG: energy transducer TonB [Proteobacteria bacterium]|nr:energy transducer TonB [Pseudomonadota bacterium]HQR04978.1 energy transducer TonB [Rhodocyclaceae bacterium]